MLTEQIEKILFTTNLNVERQAYLVEWINELLDKKMFESINGKLCYYYAILLLCEKHKFFKKIILNVFQITDNLCLYLSFCSIAYCSFLCASFSSSSS